MRFATRALLLLTLFSALSASIAYQFTPIYRIAIGKGDNAYVRNFWGLETDANSSPFRWSRASSQLVFHNAGQILPADRPITLEVRLASARPAGEEPRVQFVLQGEQVQDLGAAEIPSTITTQNLAANRGKAGPGDWTLTISSETYSPPGDNRDLGIIVRRATFRSGDGHLPILPAFPTFLYAVVTPLLLFFVFLRVVPVALPRPVSLALPLAIALAASLVIAIGIALYREQTVEYLPYLFFGSAITGAWACARVLRHAAISTFPAVKRIYDGALVFGIVLLAIGEGAIWLTNSTRIGALLLIVGAALVLLTMARPIRPEGESEGTELVIPMRSMPRRIGAPRMPYVRWVLIVAIMLAATAMRVYHLDQVLFGLFRDETRLGLLAMRVLSDPGYRPVYEGPPISQSGLLIYLLALTFSGAGASTFTLRLVGAIAGTLTVPLIWRLAKDWFPGSRKFAESIPADGSLAVRWFLNESSIVPLIAAFGLAVGTMHVYYSRFTLPYVESPLLSIPAYILLARGLKSGRWKDYALAGAFFGATQYASQVSRVSFLVGAFLIVDEIISRRGLPRNFLKGAIALALACLIVLSPLLAYVAGHADEFLARTEQVSLFNPAISAGEYPIDLLRDNVIAYASMFNIVGDSHGGHVVPTRPEFDAVTSLLFVVGFLYGLTHLRESRYRRILFWFFATLLPGILSIEAPAPLRVLETPAPTLLLSGIGAVWALRELARLAPLAPGRSGAFSYGAPVIALVLAAIAVFTNAHVYFDELGNDARLWEKNQALSTPIGSSLRSWINQNKVPATRTVFAPDWLLGSEDDVDVLNFTTNSQVKFAPLSRAPAILPPPALIVRPNVIGYWKTIIADQHAAGTVPIKWSQQDTQTLLQIEQLSANQDATEISGPDFPDSREPTFWLYVVR